MTATLNIISCLDWQNIADQLDADGYALLPGLFHNNEVSDLARQPLVNPVERRISLASIDLGRGELFALSQPLDVPLRDWYTAFYQNLLPIASRWSKELGIDDLYPRSPSTLPEGSQDIDQLSVGPYLSRLREQDYQALHQGARDGSVFPLQVVALLSEPSRDFTGGEFVIIEQRPHVNSRSLIIPLRRGDVAVVATGRRATKGNSGYAEVNSTHAIGRVRSGERLGLNLLFGTAS